MQPMLHPKLLAYFFLMYTANQDLSANLIPCSGANCVQTLPEKSTLHRSKPLAKSFFIMVKCHSKCVKYLRK